MERVSASSSHSSFSRKVVVKPSSFGIPVAENLAARTWGLAANVAAIRGPGGKFVSILARLKQSVPALLPALFSNAAELFGQIVVDYHPHYG